MAYRKTSGTLPAQPFVDWLQHQKELLERDPAAAPLMGRYNQTRPIHATLAQRLCVSEKTLYRYMSGCDGDGTPTDEFAFDNVDRMLINAGVFIHDVYEELYEDIELEPDGYCPKCREMVTPLGGWCPWCDVIVMTEKPPELGLRSHECPLCAGQKSPRAEMCKRCRLAVGAHAVSGMSESRKRARAA